MTILKKVILMRCLSWKAALVNGIVLSAIVPGWTSAAVAQRRPIADDTLGASGILSTVDALAVGNGGDIRINTGSLFLTNAAQLQTSIFGRGNAGNVIIRARDRVSVEGANQEFQSAILAITRAGTEGNGGGVSITADSIRIVNGAVVSTETENRFSDGR